MWPSSYKNMQKAWESSTPIVNKASGFFLCNFNDWDLGRQQNLMSSLSADASALN